MRFAVLQIRVFEYRNEPPIHFVRLLNIAAELVLLREQYQATQQKSIIVGCSFADRQRAIRGFLEFLPCRRTPLAKNSREHRQI